MKPDRILRNLRWSLGELNWALTRLLAENEEVALSSHGNKRRWAKEDPRHYRLCKNARLALSYVSRRRTR